VRRLLPVPADAIALIEAYPPLPARDGRPAVRVNMIASVDGATAVDGASGGLGGPADRAVFMHLRSVADVVLVGAGTVRAEGYGPPSLPPELRDARSARGQAPLPRLAVVSRSCRLDWETPLFRAGPRPIVITTEAAPDDRCAAAAEVADLVTAGREEVDLPAALEALGAAGVPSVLAEGGPHLNRALAAAGLLDELCLTVAPRLVGGDAARILAGPALPQDGTALEPAFVGEQDGFLFLRLRRRGAP
jgi:5-amino-6-(5-phosphoribosylamino)uracil reductase